MRDLILLRGLPGAGKTTLAKTLAHFNNVAADDWFDKFNDGVFNPAMLKIAHEWCRERCWQMMLDDAQVIVVHNTFSQLWEMQPYTDLAEECDYSVHTLVVENRHGSASVHDVPEKTVDKMRQRFEVKL